MERIGALYVTSWEGAYGLPLSWATSAWTVVYMSWLFTSLLFFPRAYNCMVHLYVPLPLSLHPTNFFANNRPREQILRIPDLPPLGPDLNLSRRPCHVAQIIQHVDPVRGIEPFIPVESGSDPTLQHVRADWDPWLVLPACHLCRGGGQRGCEWVVGLELGGSLLLGEGAPTENDDERG